MHLKVCSLKRKIKTNKRIKIYLKKKNRDLLFLFFSCLRLQEDLYISFSTPDLYPELQSYTLNNLWDIYTAIAKR